MFLTCFLVIQDFSPDGSNSHLEGGMTYENGRLTVPISGRYYIYAQIAYRNRGRVLIKVSDSPVSMLAPAADTPSGFDGAGTLSAGSCWRSPPRTAIPSFGWAAAFPMPDLQVTLEHI